MKIIKKGKLPPPIKFVGTCTGCHTVFECTYEELLRVTGESGHHDYTAKCPLKGCNYEVKAIQTLKQESLGSPL